MHSMKVIQFRRKPVIVVALLSACIVLWMIYKLPGKVVANEQHLVPVGDEFYLNGKPFRILSGAMHYFRIVPQYWEDRLMKLRAMGLNTVEIYVPWNLHEEVEGVFNFQGILDIRKFIATAQKLDLYVIVRPGPYICAEWDLGGLPSWLLKENSEPQLRTSHRPFLKAVEKYFGELIPMLVPLQHSNGGPIIAFQVENEYGSYDYGTFKSRSQYMEKIHHIMVNNGITDLLFTSDGLKQMSNYELKGVLKTVNFQRNATYILNQMKKIQPNKPLMVAEFWSGWFDHWGEQHHTLNLDKTANTVVEILNAGASINFYMFHGGTNFGFMNGANYEEPGRFRPTITSYDYDAPLTENGDITKKFLRLQKVIKEHVPSTSVNKHLGKLPKAIQKAAYESVEFQYYLPLDEMLSVLESEAMATSSVVPMEQLPRGGQGYGFVVYRAMLPSKTKKVSITKIRDRAQVFVDAKEIKVIEAMNEKKAYIDYRVLDKKHILDLEDDERKSEEDITLDILVENLGRVNYLTEINNQRKGILGKVLVDGKTHNSWQIFALDFNQAMFKRFIEHEEWRENKESSEEDTNKGPALYKGTFDIEKEPKDTFISMKGWMKGVCFVNGHNLGRYWHIGPQETLYIPAPFLLKGRNDVVVFELHQPNEARDATFTTEPQLASTGTSERT